MTLKQCETAIEQLILEVERLGSRIKALEDVSIYWPRGVKINGGENGRSDVGGHNETQKPTD